MASTRTTRKSRVACVLAIGASAGSFPELRRIVAAFPSGFPAAVLVVVHTSANSAGKLADVLGRAGILPSAMAKEGQTLVVGRIYVAPPDQHLLVSGNEIRLRRTARENGFRPAVDPLFRSIASSYRDRAVGVILSGALSDGALGLAAIKSLGGVAVVQDPADAAMPGMPESALRHVNADHVLSGSRLASELVGIVEQCAGCPSVNGHRIVVRPEARPVPPQDPTLMLGNGQRPAGKPTPFTCPECGGTLWEGAVAKDTSAFRCHVGHVYGEESLLVEQHERVDRAMWEAVRSLEEMVAFRREIAQRMRQRGLQSLSENFEGQAEQLQERANVVRRALEGGLAPPNDVDAGDGQTESSTTATAAFKKAKAGSRARRSAATSHRRS